MKTSPILIFTFIVCFSSSCYKTETSQITQRKNETTNTIPAGLQKLLAAYPDFLDRADENTLYWKDGTAMTYDDGIQNKTHDEKLDNPDLEDMMSQQYPKGKDWNPPPEENFEPGRIRYEPFFKKMYGSSSSEVQKNLVSVQWVSSVAKVTLQFNSVNGASDSLMKVSEQLEQLSPEFYKYIKKTAGTFNWRNIAGTNRLSTHAFGTAIDINTSYSNYWKWDGNMIWKNQIPMEIVEIFERHGFIWGGKWYHYDTMHFEYRPELLVEIN